MTVVYDAAEKNKMGASSDKDGEGPEEFTPAGAAGDDPLTRNLKLVYEQVASEPLPEHWLKLLDQLDAKEKDARQENADE